MLRNTITQLRSAPLMRYKRLVSYLQTLTSAAAGRVLSDPALF